MTNLAESLKEICRDLEELNEAFALVGGLAVSARAEPRLTRDADLAVDVADDAQAERLVHFLQASGYTVIAAVEQETTGRLATIRLSKGNSGGVVTDLLFASSGIESEIVRGAESMEVLRGLVIPVAGVGHLIALKLLARDDRRRPLDADDLRALREIASEADWNTAEAAVALIEARGYARGRPLALALVELRARGAY